MKLKEFDITLDIKKTNLAPCFEVVAGDFETNVLNIALTDGTPYSLDGLSAEIVFAKPDGTTVVQDESNGVVIEDNIIKCTLASNTIAVSGTVFAEVRVLQDAKVLTSPRFRFYVRNPILNDKTVKSLNEYPMLVQAVEDAKEAAQNAIDATQNAVIAAENANTAATNAQEAAQTAEQQADRAQGIADNFSDITLPAAISAVEAAGQAKVDLAEQQVVIATEKAREASDSAAAALASEQAAKSSEDWARIYAEDAEEFAGDAEEQAQIAANNILNGVNTHNESTAAHADIRDDIRTVEAIARGKMNSYVFDTYEDMMEAVQNPEFVEQLKVGDNFYIRDVGVKDYWWDGAAPSELEAEAPDLTDYYTKAQVDAMMPITITREDYEDLLANGRVEAGRTYFIIDGDEE